MIIFLFFVIVKRTRIKYLLQDLKKTQIIIIIKNKKNGSKHF